MPPNFASKSFEGLLPRLVTIKDTKHARATSSQQSAPRTRLKQRVLRPLDFRFYFEAVIFEIEPEIKRAKNALLESGARGALLAGSGSSVFGIFNSDEARQKALKTFRGEVGWHIFLCDTLSRNDYFRALGPCSTPLLRSFNMLSDTGA